MKIIKIILAALLLGCLLKMPYGYYQFMRIACLIGFGALAYNSFEKNKVLMIIYVGLAILFQPVAKIILPKDTWQIIDVIVAVFLIIVIVIEFFQKEKKEVEK